ncbi:MAG TPA: glycosyltransferase family 87 protein [Terracidiphilus sp.]|nr:glycosyltransferase family 87 protein [Terracidiphilus sp.]
MEMVQNPPPDPEGPPNPPSAGSGGVPRSPWRVFAAACIVAAGFVFITLVYVTNLTPQNAAGRDFIGYWATGQQLIHHADPYNTQAMLRLERGVGYTQDVPRITPSPPVAFLLLIPLGLFGAKTGLIVWLMAQLAVLSICIWMIWILFGRRDSRLHLAGYLFAPAIACLEAGQLGIFFLLGVMLFLLFHRSRPELAGAGLLLCALKPHLFLPLVLVLLLWMLRNRAQGLRILAGFSGLLALNTAVTLWFDPRVWQQYLAMLRASSIENRLTPTLGEGLRFLFGLHSVWLQWVPEVLGCAWALVYFWQRRDRWNWLDHGLLVLLVGGMCTPYAWLTDEAALLPAVIGGIFRAEDARRSLVPIALVGTAALVEVMANVQITGWGYLWTTPAWLGWYLYATWGTRRAA